MKISLTIEAGSIEHAYADSSRINSTTAQRWKVESLVARKRLELDKAGFSLVARGLCRRANLVTDVTSPSYS